jgi:transcriptional regulator with XRE-family HTH domain
MARTAPPLEQIMNAYGIRRVELASAANVDLKTIAKLFRGEHLSMKVETLLRIAGALGLAPMDLVPSLAKPRKPIAMLVRDH